MPGHQDGELARIIQNLDGLRLLLLSASMDSGYGEEAQAVFYSAADSLFNSLKELKDVDKALYPTKKGGAA